MDQAAASLLVVEDVPHILELLEVTLRFRGYQVLTARNGSEALEIIARNSPAVVITDILMPGMDGYSLAFRLRRSPATRHIPIIFLSATYVAPEDKEFALSLGAVRFLEKPVDTQEFLLVVSEVLATQAYSSLPPLGEAEFLKEYRRRLEVKLRHKDTQMLRAERLLDSLPEAQKPAFQGVLEESTQQRHEIQRELDEIYQRLGQIQNSD